MSRARKYRFLTTEQVLALHQLTIRQHGGAPGVRDMKILESAVYAPQATFDSLPLHKKPEEIAAAYLFYICQNHPFVDGNKRVGLLAALVFLDVNGYFINFSEKELEKMVFETAGGKADKKKIIAFFRKQLKKA